MDALSEPARSATTKNRVLVVDDEPQVLVALEDVLANDYEVFTI